MADRYPYINHDVKDERPKRELVKDECARATVAILRGETIEIAAAGTGIPTCAIAAAGHEAYVSLEDYAIGDLVRYAWIGHAPIRTYTAMPTGTNVMADGVGGAVTHVAGVGNWICGKLEDASSGTAGHLVRCAVKQVEA